MLHVTQIAVKNSVDVFYLSCNIPMHVLFVEDGEMDKRVFLATWKDIPAANEVQYEIKDVQHSSGQYMMYLISHHKANEVQCEIKDVQHSSGQYMMY